jgi:hypothetical protein
MDIFSELDRAGLEPYQLNPPAWRRPLREGRPDLGYPEFFRTHPSQEEDVLNEQVVKSGYASKAIVQVSLTFARLDRARLTALQTEAFSAHQYIYERLKKNSVFPNLSNLVFNVLSAREQEPRPIS